MRAVRIVSRFGVAALFVAGLAGTACVDIVQAAQYVDRQDKTFAVSGTPAVSLSTFDGSIEVRSWDKPQVAVTIEKHAHSKEAADALEVRAEQNGNQVTVEVRKPHRGIDIGWGANASAKLIVQMPANGTLKASSGDGSIDVRQVNGACDLRSGDGSITASDLAGGLTAHTGDGSIHVQNVVGGIDADTGDGSVEVDGRLEGVKVRTGDGSVDVHAAPGSSKAGDWDIVTGDGSVTLALPEDFGAELDAHTGDGRVDMDGIAVTVNGTISKSTIRGRIGNGGRQLRVRTGDGSITLRRY
jgi:hypothetical protein